MNKRMIIAIAHYADLPVFSTQDKEETKRKRKQRKKDNKTTRIQLEAERGHTTWQKKKDRIQGMTQVTYREQFGGGDMYNACMHFKADPHPHW